MRRIEHRRYPRHAPPRVPSAPAEIPVHLGDIVVILALRVDKVTEIALLVPLAAEYRAGVVVTGLAHHIDEMTALHFVDYLPEPSPPSPREGGAA